MMRTMPAVLILAFLVFGQDFEPYQTSYLFSFDLGILRYTGGIATEENELVRNLGLLLFHGTDTSEIKYAYEGSSYRLNASKFLTDKFMVGICGGYKSVKQNMEEVNKKDRILSKYDIGVSCGYWLFNIEQIQIYSTASASYSFGNIQRAAALHKMGTSDAILGPIIDEINTSCGGKGFSSDISVTLCFFSSSNRLFFHCTPRYEYSIFGFDNDFPASYSNVLNNHFFVLQVGCGYLTR